MQPVILSMPRRPAPTNLGKYFRLSIYTHVLDLAERSIRKCCGLDKTASPCFIIKRLVHFGGKQSPTRWKSQLFVRHSKLLFFCYCCCRRKHMNIVSIQTRKEMSSSKRTIAFSSCVSVLLFNGGKCHACL